MLWNPDHNDIDFRHTLLQNVSVLKSSPVEFSDIPEGVGFLTYDGQIYYQLTPTGSHWGAKVTCTELKCSSSRDHVLYYMKSIPDVYIGAIYKEGGYYLIPRRHNS